MATALILAETTWGDHMDWGPGWWIAMAVLMAAFWIAVILGIVWLVRSQSETHRHPGEPNAIELLDLRFARGEISADEYRERRTTLQEHRDT